MAFVIDSAHDTDTDTIIEQSPSNKQSSHSSSSGASANINILDKTLKAQIENIDQVNIMTEGHHLSQHGSGKRHRLQRRRRQLSQSSHDNDMEEQRKQGRYPRTGSGSDAPAPPTEVENAWENIVSHAWNMTRLLLSINKEESEDTNAAAPKKMQKAKSSRGRRVEDEVEVEQNYDEHQSRDSASNDNFLLIDFAGDDDDDDDDTTTQQDPIHKVVTAADNEQQDDMNIEDNPTTSTFDDWSHGITIDGDEEEIIPSWSNEADSLFLICHNSSEPMSGNAHLKIILERSGKDYVNVNMDNQSTSTSTSDLYFNTVHSRPNLVCVILGMQPTYAEAIANTEAEADTDTGTSTDYYSIMTIVPWIDVMKISPSVFDHIILSSSSTTDDKQEESNVNNVEGASNSSLRRLRKLRNRRAMQDNDPSKKDDLMWEDEQAKSDSDSLEHLNVIFSLVPPFNTMEDANDVIADLIAMSENGQRQRRRRRLEEEEHSVLQTEDDDSQHLHGRNLRQLSLQDAFSIAQLSHSTSNHWSRVLSRGLESERQDSCISFLQNIELESSFRSSYEFPLVTTSFTNNTTTYSPDPECTASIIAGLSTHPHIINVGTLSKTVELHNANAQWVVQGDVTSNQQTGGEWKRPFFDAGIDGSGQVVSVSDTGLDVDNCYFKDQRGDGSIFSQWDYSRRKVVRYEVSTHGGDISDTTRGHGTHVAGTVAGRHALDGTLGDGDDSKEGIAPGAKIHFYDIGKGYVVNDPGEQWFESFHNENPKRGAKIATGSWGFGYRESYDWVCQLYDQMLVDYPDVLYVSSAGNTGNKFDSPWKTVGAPASCKNVFAIGATNSAGYGSGLHYAVDFSSRGPTSDGRIKPDILAPGYALDSALSGSTNCNQKEESYLKAGTSMSAPVIAGVGALVRQYFQEGFYPCGSKGCAAEVNPSGTLVKAVLANGAQLTQGVITLNSGTTEVIGDQPVKAYDNTQNHGETNMLTSLPLDGENDFNIFIQNEASLSNDEEKSFYLELDLDSCSSDLSATLTWYDPPGANGCTICMTNDLDLLIENTSISKKHWPNGKSRPDEINNIERVRIANRRTTFGDRYKVTVKASMLGPGYSTQNFSLVVTGCFAAVNEQEPPPPVAETAVITKNHELVTTYKANRKQAGNMFGIKAKTDGVLITSFAFHTQLKGRNVKLHVYTLNIPGGLNGDEGFLNDPTKWTMISPEEGIGVTAMGFGSPTIIPAGSFPPVSITKGYTRSFYLTFIEEEEMLYKSVDNEYPTGMTYVGDDNIEIMTGVGKGVSFGINFQSRQMNGAVFYSLTNGGSGSSNDDVSTSSSTPRPTPMPTKLPSNQPTPDPTPRPVPSSPTLPTLNELTMTYTANKKQAGNMFELKAKQDFTISSFKVHTVLKSPGVPFTVYTKLGSWVNYDKDPSAWSKIGTFNADCNGYGQPTIISGFPHISILSDQMRAFYLTMADTDDSGSLQPELLYHYSETYPTGSTYAENDAMKILTGVGKGDLFGATYLARQLNGAVVYYLS